MTIKSCSCYHATAPIFEDQHFSVAGGVACVTGYSQAIGEAEERMAKGEKQIVCPTCGKWIWETLFHRKPKPPKLVHLGGRNYLAIPDDSEDES